MRTLILSIVCVFTINTLLAQQNVLTFLDSDVIESNNHVVHMKSLNSNYLEMSLHEESSNVILVWKHRLANYDLKNSQVYDNSEKATYRITYNSNQVDILVIYNNQGNILSTKETYNNIKLPLALMIKISKSYPGYAFEKNSFHTTYNSKRGTDKQYYKVQIKKGNKKTTLRLDKAFKII